MDCSIAQPTLIQLLNSSGSMETTDSITFIANVEGRSPGDYYGAIEIDAGDAGSKMVVVTVRVVDTLERVSLPTIQR